MGRNKYNNNVTEQDCEYIKKYYEQKTVKELATDLNKGVGTIYKTIQKLGLIYENRDGKVWTDDEIEFLKNNYLTMTYVEIASHLKRSLRSVHGKAHLLKLQKGVSTKNWTKEEIQFLRENANSMGYDEIAKHINRSPSAIYNKVYELQLIEDDNKNCRKLKKEQVLFIINNCDKMTDSQLAKKFGASEKAVSEVRKKHGIKKTGKEISGPTYIEIFVKNILDENGIEYIFNEKLGNYVPDFQIKNTKIIIEVQGDYYHCNPYVYTDGPKDDVQIKHVIKDYYKKCYFLSRGYTLLYIWEKDINENPEKIKETILNVCRPQPTLTEDCGI